ncbi:hypothetical protein NO2_0623 [Candidatus Termititenax persephonae]|uniref:Uncharacterized protein n=1 Tax=Candidatus Termititenax persephonae TaxID=2218525 RepID=A0A388TGR3_9BACT|nr:hypothetical protein NO2_0623 [Candidatus Termititenax persephonae]
MPGENTKVDLDIKPQIKGPLPAVKLKPAESQRATSEQVTNLVLNKYNALRKHVEALKVKLLALPLLGKILGLFKNIKNVKNQYLNKEALTAGLSQLKDKTQSLNQTKSLLGGFNKKFNLTAKLTDLNNKFGKNAIQAKFAKVKEDLQDIQQQGKNILQNTLQNSINKDSKPTA